MTSSRPLRWFLLGLLVHLGGCRDPEPALFISSTDSLGIDVITINGSPGSIPFAPLGGLLGAISVPDSSNVPGFTRVLGGRFLSDGGVVVADSRNTMLYVFDAGGELLRSMGGRGDGPGEFRTLSAFTVLDANTLAAFDRLARRLIYFDLHGGVVKTTLLDEGFRIGLALVCPDDTGAFLLVRKSNRRGWLPDGEARFLPRTDCIRYRGTDGEVPSRSFCVAAATEVVVGGISGSPVFQVRPQVAIQGDQLVLSPGAEFELVVLDKDLLPQTVVRWPDLDRPITDFDLEQERRRLSPPGRPPAESGLINAMFSNEALPKVKPAIGRLIVDDRSNYWVGIAGPLREVTRDWYVIAPTGVPLKKVRLPPRAEVLDVKGDQVLTVRLDSLDVPIVERYSNGAAS